VTDSYLGFKGEERLGGGLSAWFQCETTMDIRAFDQTGLCSRNSALGFKGGFGNIYGGRWHTPFSNIYHQIGADGATGLLGVSRINGNSGSTSFADHGGAAGPSTPSYSRAQFRRRESCLTRYDSPDFGGFQVGVAVSCGNAASDGHTSAPSGGSASAATNGAGNKKPRVYSIAGTYNQGPLGLGLGYQKHDEVGPYNTAGPDLSDRAWGASVRYTYGPVLAGATYMDRKWETSATQSVKNKTWTIGAEWNIAGPHTVGAFYGNTGDASGNATQNTAGSGGTATNPSVISGNGGVTNVGNDTGYSVWSLTYTYAFSKRTKATLGYTRYDNDANSAAVRPYNTAATNGTAGTVINGQALDVYAVSIKHSF